MWPPWLIAMKGIVQGLGNPESFQSCSHGAGRLMSRKEANRRFSFEDVRRAMVLFLMGGEKEKKHLDISEAPLAYKDIE